MNSSDDRDRTAPLPGAGRYTGDEPKLPVRLGNYMLVELLGRGAMGRVYRADQLEPVRRTVAVKLLSTELVDRDVLARFEAERQALALMSHPNIAQVFDAGATDAGQPYFVMEYAPGEILTRHCDMRRLDLDDRLRLFARVVSAIQHAHQKGIIHRDIKPSNILVTEDDGEALPKVIDFGLAKALSGNLGDRSLRTHIGTLLGTPAYMSPEQAALSVEAVDTRSDIYALGLVLYELLTGDLPFGRMGDRRTTIDQMLRAIREDEPTRPSAAVARTPRDALPPGLDPGIRGALRQDLDWIVLKCLAKQPDQRYPGAGALLADIQRFLDQQPVQARRSTFGYVLGKQMRRHRAAIGVTAGVLTLAAVLGGGWLDSRMEAAARAEAAQRFGQSVERLDGLLRLAHTVPLHDTTPTRQRLADRLAALEADIENLDEWSRGPARYAMGRVALSLDREETALGHLESAWEGGYRPPEVANALGLAHGRLYQAGLEALEGETNEEQRRVRQQELIEQYRDPAVRLLDLGDSGLGRPRDYGDALIAFYEDDLARARELAGRAARETPWLYEAIVLEGDAWRAEGNTLRDAGDYQAALSAYDEADAAYGRAAAVGESDPGVYTARCGLAADRLQLHLYGPSADTTGVFRRGAGACRDALVAHPGSAGAHARQARLLLMQGRLREKAGDDPAALYKQSASAGERSAELGGDVVTGLLNAGTAYQRLAELESDRSGSDPEQWLAKAAEVFGRALDKAPDNPDIYNELGNVHAIRGEYLQFYTSEDPLPDFRLARRYYEEALRRRPDSPYIYNNQGILFADFAEELRVTGGDPVPWYERAFDSYRRAVELKPDHTFAFNNLGIAYVNRSRHASQLGQDPLPWLDRSVEALQQAVALRPDYRNGWHNLGRSYMNRMEEYAERDRDPHAEADRALAAYQRALDVEPTADTWLNIGNTQLTLARYYAARGRDPEPALQHAWEAFEKALAIVPNHTHALGNRWDVAITRGSYQVSRGRDARPEARRAIEGLAELAERFPDNFEPREKLADAWLLKARYEYLAGLDPSASLDRARQALDQALAINANASDVVIDIVDAALLRARWLLRRDGNAGGAVAEARAALAMLAESGAPDSNREWQAAKLRVSVTEAWAAREESARSAALDRARQAAVRHRAAMPEHPESARLIAAAAAWRHRLTGEAPPASALDAARALVDERPKDAEAWLILHRLLKAGGSNAEAERSMQQAVTINPLIRNHDLAH